MKKKILRFEPWLGSFPLSPFLEKLHELKSAEGKRRILILTDFRVSLYTVLTTYTWIGFILRRIDENLYNNLELHKKLRLVSQGVRVTADELPPSTAHLTNIDINSLIIYLNVLMDDVTRFLKFLLIGKSTPKTKNFDKLKKTIINFEGHNLEDLSRIIQNTNWYKEFKDLRDKQIIHKGDKDSGIGIHGNNIGIYLRYIQDRKIREKFISNLEIDKITENVCYFLMDLNDYLCNNYDYLPIEVLKKNDVEELPNSRSS